MKTWMISVGVLSVAMAYHNGHDVTAALLSQWQRPDTLVQTAAYIDNSEAGVKQVLMKHKALHPLNDTVLELYNAEGEHLSTGRLRLGTDAYIYLEPLSQSADRWQTESTFYQLGQYKRPSNYAAGNEIQVTWFEGVQIKLCTQDALCFVAESEPSRYIKAGHQLY